MKVVEKGTFSVPEAARWLGVSADTVRREIKDGRLPRVFIRATPVVPAAALARYVDGLSPDPT